MTTRIDGFPTEAAKLLERIRKHFSLKKTGLYKYVAEKLDVEERQVARWYKGDSVPYEDNMEKLKSLLSGNQTTAAGGSMSQLEVGIRLGKLEASIEAKLSQILMMVKDQDSRLKKLEETGSK